MSTVVFPLPAPAKMSSGPFTVNTACFWRPFMRAKSFSSTARRSARISDLSICSNDLRSVGSVSSRFFVSILLYLAKKFNRT